MRWRMKYGVDVKVVRIYSLGHLAGRCGVTGCRFLSLSLLLSFARSWIQAKACNINYARIRIARAEKQDAERATSKTKCAETSG